MDEKQKPNSKGKTNNPGEKAPKVQPLVPALVTYSSQI